MASSVHLFVRLGVELTSIHAAWRLLHLRLFRGHCHLGKYQSSFLSDSFVAFPNVPLFRRVTRIFPFTPRISARPAFF